MNPYQEYRESKDAFFATHPQSPMTPDQKRDFQRLDYFDENQDLALEVVVEQFSEQRTVSIQTSTGQSQTYIRYGKFKFSVNGEEAELTLFASEHGYFLPFVDSLAGEETYPAGRYLDPEPGAGDRFRIDFNLAYNPYCAYNEMWSCPLTPPENRINVPIRAGEKIYK